MENPEEYYRALSEVYLLELQDYIEPSQKIMVAMGVVVEMNSDLVSYLLKSKETDKSKKQAERLKILIEAINYFSVFSDRHFQSKRMVRSIYANYKKLEDTIKEKDREIEILTKMLNDGED